MKYKRGSRNRKVHIYNTSDHSLLKYKVRLREAEKMIKENPVYKTYEPSQDWVDARATTKKERSKRHRLSGLKYAQELAVCPASPVNYWEIEFLDEM